MTLSSDTLVRTARGNVPIGQLIDGDVLHDEKNAPVAILVGPLIPLGEVYRVSYKPSRRRDPVHYRCDGKQLLYLYVAPLACVRSNKDGYQIVWTSRCQAALHPQRLRPRSTRTLKSWLPASETEAVLPAAPTTPSTTRPAPPPTTKTTSMRLAAAAATSQAKPTSRTQPPAEVVKTRLGHECSCGAIRQLSITGPSRESMAHLIRAAESPTATNRLEPNIVHPFDIHRLRAAQFSASKHVKWEPLKMPLVRFQVRNGHRSACQTQG